MVESDLTPFNTHIYTFVQILVFSIPNLYLHFTNQTSLKVCTSLMSNLQILWVYILKIFYSYYFVLLCTTLPQKLHLYFSYFFYNQSWSFERQEVKSESWIEIIHFIKQHSSNKCYNCLPFNMTIAFWFLSILSYIFL